MNLIDLEAHFLTRDFAEYIRSIGVRRSFPDDNRLFDLGEGRIEEMDKAGINMQVISLFQPPHIQMFEASVAKTWAKSTNDELSVAVKKYPDKFVGLAALPLQNPGEAVEELKRAVTELGFKGACLLQHVRNEYLDNKKYWIIFEEAERLEVPIYLHPQYPSAAMAAAYADYGELSGPAHGFYADCSLNVMRLIYSGLFDRYPRLRMILGHMGEGLPYWFQRIDSSWLRRNPVEKPAIKKKPSDYLKTNFTITTSGMFFQPALICSYLALGADRISFAVDYPAEENSTAVQFIKEAPICDSDKKKICHSNAEALFKL